MGRRADLLYTLRSTQDVLALLLITAFLTHFLLVEGSQIKPAFDMAGHTMICNPSGSHYHQSIPLRQRHNNCCCDKTIGPIGHLKFFFRSGYGSRFDLPEPFLSLCVVLLIGLPRFHFKLTAFQSRAPPLYR